MCWPVSDIKAWASDLNLETLKKTRNIKKKINGLLTVQFFLFFMIFIFSIIVDLQLSVNFYCIAK